VSEEQEQAEAPIDLRNEECQRSFDEQVVAGTLAQLRKALANAKTNFHLASAGMLKAEGPRQGVHPGTVKQDIIDLRANIDFLVKLADGIEKGEALAEPKDSGLVVVESGP